MKEIIDDIIEFLDLKGSEAVELKYKLMNMSSDLSNLISKLRKVDLNKGDEQYKALVNGFLNLINHYGEK